MTFHTYILYSEKFDRYYIGSTQDLENRLEQHNNGNTRSTKGKGPWKMVWNKKFESRQGAVAEEMRLKAKKSRKYLEWIIAQR